MKSLQPYNKGIVALIGVGLTVLAPHFGAQQVFQWLTGIVTVLGVIHIPNGAKKDVSDIMNDIYTAAIQDGMTPGNVIDPTITSTGA